jgi:hypothetical protein
MARRGLRRQFRGVLVYGDSQFEATGRELIQRLEQTMAATDPGCLDDVRRLLVQVGQVEQAIDDANGPQGAQIRQLTDAAAEAFVSCFGGESSSTAHAAVKDAFARLSAADTGKLTVRIPEGFEFYSLYPEQYVLSAEEWSRENAQLRKSPGRVEVIGVRSIGTTLSAVVQAVLRRQGWKARRWTVRPRGHPFDRVAALPAEVGREAAIVVDEGPGLSGSSMAAVAQALHDGGAARERVFFFPGSENGPGRNSNENVREWWSTTKRYFTPRPAIRWDGKLLTELLADRTQELLGSVVVETQDFSAGAWRRHVFADEAEWPAVAALFERQKFRIVTRSGKGLLWKFTGSGGMTSEPDIAVQIEERARLGWTAAPRERCHGFTALPWIEGRPLTPSDADDQIIQQLAQYIADVAGAPMSARESEAAVKRLAMMVRENTGKILELPCTAGEACYGDGRMAPHEWLVTKEGRLYKTDAHAHTQDHTLVGRQSSLWDVAGTVVEWEFTGAEQSALLRALGQSGHEFREEELNFYVEAYAAFRMGLLKLCGDFAGRVPIMIERRGLVGLEQ